MKKKKQNKNLKVQSSSSQCLVALVLITNGIFIYTGNIRGDCPHELT